jgi:DNA helicase HerA-like ATPase
MSLLFRSDLVTGDSSQSITARIIRDLMDRKVVLVDTSNMFEAEELLVSTVLMRAVFQHNKNAYGDEKKFREIPPMLLALEEAQRVLGMSRGNIFSQIAREGRKFRTGLCAVSQQPKLISNEVISQFNTLFIMGLADRRDREILKDSARQDIGQLDNEIQMLMPGEGLITSPKSPFALPVRIYLFEERLDDWNSEYRPPERAEMARTDSSFY